ncbi:MAG: DUF5696 domain-containing protein, partial [Victivallales bacterium]|nr:DUF5696 domain-containing protein [Victivallales bacterium]
MIEARLKKSQIFLTGSVYDRALQREIFDVSFSWDEADSDRFYCRSEQYGIWVPIVLSHDQIEIENDRILENSFGGRYRLMRLSLLPELLKSQIGDEGGYLLPDFSGVTVNFSSRSPIVNRDRLYMEQREWEKMTLMNCFGKFTPAGGILLIVDDGDFYCNAVTSVNENGEYRLYPEFLVREHHSEPLRSGCFRILYRTSPESGWVPLAKLYRHYFMKEKQVRPLTDRIATNPVLAYSAEAIRVKIFMAGRLPYRPDGSGDIHTFASCSETIDILNQMKSRGIEKAVITLVGWNLGGHDGSYPAHFPVESAIGGEKALRELISHARKLGYQIVPHDNVTDAYASSPGFDPGSIAREKNGEMVMAGIWGGGLSVKICPLKYLERYGVEFEHIHELGFCGHYYLDAQSTVLWECHDRNHRADKRHFALALVGISAIPRRLFGAVSTELVTAYSVPYIDEVARLHTPFTNPTMLERCPESFRDLNPNPVPFFHIALHGLILYSDGWNH